jgi:hypothetical protein
LIWSKHGLLLAAGVCHTWKSEILDNNMIVTGRGLRIVDPHNALAAYNSIK